MKLCKALDDQLTEIFSGENGPAPTMLGYGFGADLTQFALYAPNMNFLDKVPKFIDMCFFYRKCVPEWRKSGGSALYAVCEKVLLKKLCKYEQVSNWELRPLRQSQLHYAMMDVYSLPILIKKMEEKFDKSLDGKMLEGMTKALNRKSPSEYQHKVQSLDIGDGNNPFMQVNPDHNIEMNE